jgi:hypothetical protein
LILIVIVIFLHIVPEHYGRNRLDTGPGCHPQGVGRGGRNWIKLLKSDEKSAPIKIDKPLRVAPGGLELVYMQPASLLKGKRFCQQELFNQTTDESFIGFS